MKLMGTKHISLNHMNLDLEEFNTKSDVKKVS